MSVSIICILHYFTTVCGLKHQCKNPPYVFNKRATTMQKMHIDVAGGQLFFYLTDADTRIKMV